MKDKIEFNESVHGVELAKLIKEASDQKTIQESYGEKIKELKEKAKIDLGVEPKLWSKLFAIYHNSTRERFESENTEVIDKYDSIFPAK